MDELITLGKRGDLHARRQAAQVLQDVVDPATGKTLFKNYLMKLQPKFADKNGGYTRVLKTYNRKGDNAPMAIIELYSKSDGNITFFVNKIIKNFIFTFLFC